ncbi:fibronectin type III domain-containing protein [Thermotalea metallivorans]|uniref:Fibronectin type-III domain-containing protein n=1 Tax=Thermotalea metallivorans TaxID=520762 RepID=A0A140L9X5_9FIRM|nr:fibronectin type III domain-containing protein [Thermotalea metallivorans]KXG77350.1 hypothetical protein AN619_04760 [Thermotalea metallivorans]
MKNRKTYLLLLLVMLLNFFMCTDISFAYPEGTPKWEIEDPAGVHSVLEYFIDNADNHYVFYRSSPYLSEVKLAFKSSGSSTFSLKGSIGSTNYPKFYQTQDFSKIYFILSSGSSYTIKSVNSNGTVSNYASFTYASYALDINNSGFVIENEKVYVAARTNANNVVGLIYTVSNSTISSQVLGQNIYISGGAKAGNSINYYGYLYSGGGYGLYSVQQNLSTGALSHTAVTGIYDSARQVKVSNMGSWYFVCRNSSESQTRIIGSKINFYNSDNDFALKDVFTDKDGVDHITYYRQIREKEDGDYYYYPRIDYTNSITSGHHIEYDDSFDTHLAMDSGYNLYGARYSYRNNKQVIAIDKMDYISNPSISGQTATINSIQYTVNIKSGWRYVNSTGQKYKMIVATDSAFTNIVRNDIISNPNPTSTNSFNYTITGLASGTLYWVRLIVMSNGIMETPFKTDFVWYTLPNIPTNASVTGIGSNSLEITWNNNNNSTNGNYTAFEVERSLTGNPAGTDWVKVFDGNATTFKDTGLIPKTQYYYRIRARNGWGQLSGYTNIFSARTTSLPTTPTIIYPTYNAIMADNASLSASSTQEDGLPITYEWQYKKGTMGTWMNIGSGIGSVSWNTTALVDGNDYYVRVRAVLASGDGSAWSQEVPVTVVNLKNIGSVTIGGKTSTGVTLNWTDTNASFINYNIYRKIEPSGAWVKINTVAGKTYIDTGLTPNSNYGYTIEPVCGSKVGTSKTITAVTYANAPTTFTYPNVQVSEIILTWDKNSNPDGTLYELESKKEGGTFAKIYEGTLNAFTHTNLEPNTTYYYRVRAKNSINELSGYSSESYTKTLKPKNSAPNISLVLNDGADATNTTAVTAKVYVADDITPNDKLKVFFQINGGSWIAAGNPNSNGELTYTINLPDIEAKYTILAKVQDEEYAIGIDSETILYSKTAVTDMNAAITNIYNEISKLDLAAPNVRADVGGITATKNSSITVSIAATDDITVQSKLKYRYSINGVYPEDETWKPLISNKVINLGSTGLNKICIEVIDEKGKIGSSTVQIWRINQNIG